MSAYACVDGVYFKEEQVVKMAQNACAAGTWADVWQGGNH